MMCAPEKSISNRPTITVADREDLHPERWGSDATYEGEYETSSSLVNGVRIEFTDWNRSASDVVLMIHGLGVQGHTWDPIAHWLASRYRVLCPDLRGHGRSDWSRDGYGVRDFASDLVQLLEHIGVDRLDVIGHSLGARVALAVAASDRLRVDHVLLSDMGPEVPRSGARLSHTDSTQRAEPRGYRDREEVLAYFREVHPLWQPIFLELHALYQVRLNWAGRLVPCDDPELLWIRGEAGRRDYPYLWECCASIKAPVHMMWAAEGPFVDDAIIDRMHATMAQFTDEKLDCGHYIPREHPDYFCHRLLEFLNRGAIR